MGPEIKVGAATLYWDASIDCIDQSAPASEFNKKDWISKCAFVSCDLENFCGLLQVPWSLAAESVNGYGSFQTPQPKRPRFRVRSLSATVGLCHDFQVDLQHRRIPLHFFHVTHGSAIKRRTKMIMENT